MPTMEGLAERLGPTNKSQFIALFKQISDDPNRTAAVQRHYGQIRQLVGAVQQEDPVAGNEMGHRFNGLLAVLAPQTYDRYFIPRVPTQISNDHPYAQPELVA